MKLDNVYYGFTKDGKYGLFLKKYKTYYTDNGDVSATFYYDLEDKYEFNMDDMDLNTLKPITKMVGYNKNMKKRKVKKMYKADVDTLIDVEGAYYGNILKKRMINGVYPKCEILKENVLFARIDDPLGRSIDLKTGILYERSERIKEGICVMETHPIKTEDFENVVEPKRKILELDYKKRL